MLDSASRQRDSASRISSVSGKRPRLFFEKTSVPSRVTSKTPPLDSTSLGLAPNFLVISAARLAALGR